ncbi:MAG TPA: hypothetical protein VER96_34065 [Polyangiaceae bacterium]|nr:hypothetical protein [Polyangiaceae bacterium]
MKSDHPTRGGLASAWLLALFAGCHSSNSAAIISDSCILNSDCVAPFMCVSGTCHIQCRDKGDCVSPNICEAGVCTPPLPSSGGARGTLDDPSAAGVVESGQSDSGAGSGGEAGGGGSLVDDSESAGAAGEANCVNGGRELGQIVYWCSKVNVHSTSSGWQTDADCDSGCYEDPLSYCAKFWPKTSSYERVPLSPELKPFDWKYCANVEYSRGETQYTCCGSL